MKNIYHGWIVVEQEEGYTDSVFVEYQDGETRKRVEMGRGQSGCTKAVEWWDAKLNTHILLEPMLKGSYRVYTQGDPQI